MGRVLGSGSVLGLLISRGDCGGAGLGMRALGTASRLNGIVYVDLFECVINE